MEDGSIMSKRILYEVRRITVLLMLILGVVILVSGVTLYTFPRGPRSGTITVLGITKRLWIDIHVYTAFTLVGLTILHVYLNLPSIICYVRGLRKFKS